MDNFWKRIPRGNKSRDSQQIGSPVLVNSSVDSERLQNMPSVHDARPSHTGSYQPAPTPTSYGNARNQINSMAPSVSSVYSQPYDHVGTNNRQARAPVASSYYGDGDVSPPESPHSYPVQQPHNDGDVSPIDNTLESDIHPAFRTKNKLGGSNIPVPRKNPPVARKVTPRAYNRDPNQPLKWDKYTGEPTSPDKGVDSGVKPESVVAVLERTRAALQSARLRSAPDAAANSATKKVETRPPWKGASGREAVVPPVQDKPGQKLPIPQREVRRPVAMPTPPMSSSPVIARTNEAEHETEHASTSPRQPQAIETIRPVGTPDRSNAGETSSYAVHPVTNTHHPSSTHNAAPIPADAYNPRTPTEDTPRRSDDTIRNNEQRKRSNSRPDDQFDSRFSWTTQATNTTYQGHSPPPSPPPPLPTNFPHYSSFTNPPADSIMNRRRPVPARTYSPPSPVSSPIISNNAPRRKPIGLGLGVSTLHPTRTSSRAPSIHSTTTTTTSGGDKALPPTPQQLASSDHVGQLNAQLDDLRNQRRNLDRILRDLEGPEAKNPLNTTFREEREREKNIVAIKSELNEINMLEHDIGLKLHRANKKREREEGYEGFTTLWVRRVTS
ncbi:hypothetical protein BT63DRAFT_172447 [Microthyrium microscopicum]|uniref:Uncharacterized protein n=1 Tax=Microthyrium microscopicum TaxID=703497 RepID=A0A6A6UQA6_9PEZI|nr:hypothetical protein BT63DRAFT_172447 [Microthyrium microscopicum]